MTVSKALVKWLQDYEGLSVAMVQLENVGAAADSCGLYRSPNREVTDYNCSDYKIKEYYELFIKKDSQTASERADADRWIENLAYWIDDCGYEEKHPTIDNKRIVQSVELTSSPYAIQNDNKGILWHLGIGVEYIRKREDEEEW